MVLRTAKAKALSTLSRCTVACASLILAAAAVLQMVGCNFFRDRRDGKDGLITIGAIFPVSNQLKLSGPETVTWGIHSAFGALIAKETINRGGGVLGKKLDLIILDGQGNPDIAMQRYNEHKNNGVVAIIGPPIGGIAGILSEKAKNDGLPFMMQNLPQQQLAARKDYCREHPAMKDLNDAYYVNFGYGPHQAASNACECVIMLVDAIKMAGGTNKKEVISAINEISQNIFSNPENSKN